MAVSVPDANRYPHTGPRRKSLKVIPLRLHGRGDLGNGYGDGRAGGTGRGHHLGLPGSDGGEERHLKRRVISVYDAAMSLCQVTGAAGIAAPYWSVTVATTPIVSPRAVSVTLSGRTVTVVGTGGSGGGVTGPVPPPPLSPPQPISNTATSAHAQPKVGRGEDRAARRANRRGGGARLIGDMMNHTLEH